MVEEFESKSKISTKLIVEREIAPVKNVDNGAIANLRRLTVGRMNTAQPYSYYRLSNMSRTRSIEVLMRTGEGLKNVQLPPRILERISEYISKEDDILEQDFDCNGFAHYINGIPYKFGEFSPDEWDVVAMHDESTLRIGDTIFIAEVQNPQDWESGQITHFAIYIGDHLYLSKFGNSKLIAANIEEMKKLFGGNQIYIASPKAI